MEAKPLKESESSGGVVLNQEGKILVVNQDLVHWSFPKGHIEAGESELDAAKREIYEESGIDDLVFKKDLGSYQRTSLDDEQEIKTIYMFLFYTPQIEFKVIDPENPKAQWIEKEKVASLLTHPKDKEFFLEIKKKI